jgi:hypothetical protein
VAGEIPDRRSLARQTIGRIPRVTQCFETHRTGIDHQKAADETFAEADDLANHLKRISEANTQAMRQDLASGMPAALAGGGGSGTAAIVRIGIPSARVVRWIGRQRTIEGTNRRGDEWFPREIAGVGQDNAWRVSEPSADVVSRYQSIAFAAMSAKVNVSTLTSNWIFAVSAEASDLGPANVGRCENDLPLQVRQRHIVVVDDADRADTRRCQIEQYRRTQSAGADDQHACSLQFCLPRTSHLAQDDVAGIALEFFGSKHRG